MTNPWVLFWGGLLAVTLISYVILAVVVTIGGFGDIREMFRKLSRRDGE